MKNNTEAEKRKRHKIRLFGRRREDKAALWQLINIIVVSFLAYIGFIIGG